VQAESASLEHTVCCARQREAAEPDPYGVLVGVFLTAAQLSDRGRFEDRPMKVLHFPVRGRPPGGERRDGPQRPGSRDEHILQQPRCRVCGQPLRYPEDEQLGWCDRCRTYTGKCQAGRDLGYPGHLGGGGWQVPCPRPWSAWWDLALPGGVPLRARLCDEHGAAVRHGEAPITGRQAAARPPGGEAIRDG
jgi:hypothetical protein